MVSVNRIRVLSAFKPFLRLIEAYNAENFENFHYTDLRQFLDWVRPAFISTVLNVGLSAFILFGVWDLTELYKELQKFVVALPLVISLLQMEITLIALMAKNRAISAIIQQIQRVIEKRKCLRCCSLNDFCYGHLNGSVAFPVSSFRLFLVIDHF